MSKRKGRRYNLYAARTRRQNAAIARALANFARGWHEAMTGQLLPLEDLWKDDDNGQS